MPRAETHRARVANTVVFFLTGAVFAAWSTRLPAIKESLHLSNGALAIAILGLETGAIAGLPAGGALVARTGSRIALRAGFAGYPLGLLGVGLAGDVGGETDREQPERVAGESDPQRRAAPGAGDEGAARRQPGDRARLEPEDRDGERAGRQPELLLDRGQARGPRGEHRAGEEEDERRGGTGAAIGPSHGRRCAR